MADALNRYNGNSQYDEDGRMEHRRIFGVAKPIEGRQRWIDGKWVPIEEARKMRVPGVKVPLMKVSDSNLDVAVHRAARNPKHTGVRNVKGYRSIGS